MLNFKPLPNTVRENLLQGGDGALALVLDVVLFVGLTGEFTVDELLAILRGYGLVISSKTVRKGLSNAIWRPRVRREDRAGKAGRPSMVYRVPDRSELVRFFGDGRELSADPLHARDLSSVAAYRAGLHREFVRRAPGSYSRRFLGGRLGVSKSATRFYERESVVECRTDFAWDFVTDPDSLPVGGVRNSSFLLVIRDDDERLELMNLEALGTRWRVSDFSAEDLPGRRLPLVRFLAKHYARMGFMVYLVRQKPNYYSVNETKYQMAYGKFSQFYDSST